MPDDRLRLSAEQAGDLLGAMHGSIEKLPLQVHGRSMRPFIRDGDRVLISTVDPARLRIGEVICGILPGGRAVIHRLIRIERGSGGLVLTTRGDSRVVCDPPLGEKQVLGRVVAVEGGRLKLDPTSWWARTAGLAWNHGFQGYIALRRMARFALKRNPR